MDPKETQTLLTLTSHLVPDLALKVSLVEH
jgi:hypothetical protein